MRGNDTEIECYISMRNLNALKRCIEVIRRNAVVCPDMETAYKTAMQIIDSTEKL